MEGRTRKIGACLAVGLSAVWSWPLASPGGTGGASLPCEAPVQVDGELRCEGEWPTDLGAWCRAGGETPPPRAVLVRPGDAIDRRGTCRQGRVSRIAPREVEALGLAVDVNTASAAELASLPRIGPRLARRVIEARPVADVASLDQVRGIGPKTLAGLRERARVGPGPALVEWVPSPGS